MRGDQNKTEENMKLNCVTLQDNIEKEHRSLCCHTEKSVARLKRRGNLI